MVERRAERENRRQEREKRRKEKEKRRKEKEKARQAKLKVKTENMIKVFSCTSNCCTLNCIDIFQRALELEEEEEEEAESDSFGDHHMQWPPIPIIVTHSVLKEAGKSILLNASGR